MRECPFQARRCPLAPPPRQHRGHLGATSGPPRGHHCRRNGMGIRDGIGAFPFPPYSHPIPAEFPDDAPRPLTLGTATSQGTDGDSRQGQQGEGDRSALHPRGDTGPPPGGDTGPRPLPGAAARLGRDGDTGQGRPLPGQGGIPEDPPQVRDHLPAAPRAQPGQGRLSPPCPQPQPAHHQRHLPARRAQRALRVHGAQGGGAEGGAAPGRTQPHPHQGHRPGPGHGPPPRDADAPGRGALRGSRAGIRLGAERLARLRLTPNPTPGDPEVPKSTRTVPKSGRGAPPCCCCRCFALTPQPRGGFGGIVPLGVGIFLFSGVGEEFCPWNVGWEWGAPRGFGVGAMSPGRVLVLLPAPLFWVFSPIFLRFFLGFSSSFPLFFSSWYKDQEQFQEVLCAYIYIYIYI